MGCGGELRANTAVDVLIGPFVDDTDGKTAETGLTIDVELSKNGQALTNKSDITAPVHDANGDIDGYYNCEFDTTDTNTEGNLTAVCFASGALPVRHDFMVLSEAAWDSKYVAKDDGFMDVNVKTVGRADTQETEADNLEAACAAYSATRGLTGTALPAVAADGAGGIPISDAGGLDLDAIKTMTDKIGTVVNTGGTATIGAVLGDFANSALVTRLGAPSDLGSGASLAKNLVDIEGQTDDIGVAGAGLTALPWNNAVWDAEVQSECDDAITANVSVAAILADTGTDGVVVAGASKTGYAIGVGGIAAAAFAAGAIDAAALNADAAAEIADKLLGRNIAGGSDGGRTVTDALRILRNKRAVAAGTLTVYQENDTTSAWTAAVGTAASDPVSSIDPA